MFAGTAGQFLEMKVKGEGIEKSQIQMELN